MIGLTLGRIGQQPASLRRSTSRALPAAACALALASPLLASLAGAAGPYRIPRPVAKTLDNGLKVVVFPDSRLPVVEIQLRLPAGVDAEPPEQNGVASVTTRLLSRGTTSRDAESFERELGQLGAKLSASVGREYATVSCQVLAGDFETGTELIGDAVVHPIFPDEEFQDVVSQVGRGVIQLHLNALAAAGEQLWTLLLPDAAVARPPLGTLESLGRLTRNQVRAFYHDRFRPDGSVLAIAGDVTAERALSAAVEWFGRWPAGGARPAAAPRPPRRTPGKTLVRIVDQPGASGCALALGLEVPGRDSPDALARSVAAALFEERLEQGRAGGAGRDARSSLELTRDFGVWSVHATAPADSAAVLARRLVAELKRFLAATPAPQEVAAVEHRIRLGFPLAFETAPGLVGQWLIADLAGFPADYFDTYGARVAALKPEVLRAAARREADPDHPAIVAVGVAARLEPILKTLGPVEVVRPDRLPELSASAADTLPPPTAEQESAGRRLVDLALATHGGRDRLSGIHSSLVDGQVRLYLPGSEVTGRLRQLRKDPYKMAFASSIEGMDSRQVLNGNRAWTVFAQTDTVREGDSLEVSALRTGFTSDLPHLLLEAADPRARVAARSRERIGARDADRVEVVTPAGERRTLFFDAESHRLVALEQREGGPRGIFESRRVYGDYRTVNGIAWPFEEERFLEGQPVMKLDVTGVELNLELGEDQFEPPAAGPSWR